MQKIVYQGKIFEVVEETTESGKVFEFAQRSPGVRLIIEKDNQILLSKEFRREVGGYDYRLSGGKVFDLLADYNTAFESGENIENAAKAAAIKEAHEEAGIEVKNIEFFHKSVCGATVVWDLFYFVVKEFSEINQKLEDGEDIKIEWVSKENAKSMCLDGSMSEERSALVLFRYLN